jgi:hypothetical protein
MPPTGRELQCVAHNIPNYLHYLILVYLNSYMRYSLQVHIQVYVQKLCLDVKLINARFEDIIGVLRLQIQFQITFFDLVDKGGGHLECQWIQNKTHLCLSQCLVIYKPQ